MDERPGSYRVLIEGGEGVYEEKKSRYIATLRKCESEKEAAAFIEELHNAAAVVTRYFGGVLLGTGGLVRAYTQAVKAGLSNCRIGRMRAGVEVEVNTDYNGIGKILYLLGNRGLEPVSCDYTDKVALRIQVPVEELEHLRKEMVEATNGRVGFEKLRELYFVDREQS